VEVGQLLIKLALGLSELIEAHWASVARWRGADSESLELLEANATQTKHSRVKSRVGT
jgi:hypothetical protein